MSIYGRDLAEDVQWGRLDPATAELKFDEGYKFVERGRTFIRTATILNPILWPFRGIIMTNCDAAELAMNENRERITGEVTTPTTETQKLPEMTEGEIL